MPAFTAPNSRYVDISGNRPLIINNPGYIYLVESDNVDVFAVHLREGEIEGGKDFLFRAVKNSLLLGLDPHGYGTGLAFLISGKPGSRLREMPAEALTNASSESNETASRQVRDMVESWAENLLKAFDHGVVPKDTCFLTPGSHELNEGINARIKTGTNLLWINQPGSACYYFSLPHWPCPEGDPFPLSEKSWITAHKNTTVQCITHEKYQQSDPGYKALENFHAGFMKCVLESQKIRYSQEKVRQQEVAQNDEDAFSATLSLLADSMNPDQPSGAGASAYGDDLLAACRIVGGQSGIHVQEPPVEAMLNVEPLQAIARASGFRVRQVALKGQWWKNDGGPMLGYLAHLETGKPEKPVAIIQSSQGRYFLEEPGSGAMQRVDNAVNHELAMFAYIFYRPLPHRRLKAMDLFRHGLYRLGRDQAMMLIMSVASALLALVPPVATGIIFSTLIPEAERSSMFYIGAILFSAALATGLFEITKSIAVMRMVGKIDLTLQAGVMDRVLSLPTSFFRNYVSGDLAERTMGINAIRETLSNVTLQAFLSGIFSVFSLGLLFYYSWQLALVALGITILTVGIISAMGYAQIRYQRDIQNLQGQLSGMVLQLITGVAKLRISGTEKRAFSRWAEKFSSMRKLSYKARSVSNHVQAFGQTLPVISLLVIIAWIVFTPLIDHLSVGSIVAFNAAFVQFQAALIQMALVLTASLQIVPLYERAKPILEALPEVDEGKSSPGQLTGDIELNNLFFRYSPDGPLILNDVSMRVKAGEFAAVVGGSGSGKSTLLRLLLGFETPFSGSIYYDDRDLNDLDVSAVRRQLGVVLQNGSLMSGDVFTNIIGSSTLTIDDAWEAARMAGLDKDIENMPMGMHTMVSEGGGSFSGGQRQRLLIARAVVHKPRILYFDEATSALDNTTQKQVSESLEKLSATRLVIAHRLSTIIHADRIFVLDKGTIVQQGKYKELMSQPGLFAELAKRQVV